MIIYRIQNDENTGVVFQRNNEYKYPQNLSYNYSHLMKDGTERLQHPDSDYGTPLAKAYDNNLIKKGSPYLFGVQTIKDLYTWFSPVDIGYYELNGYWIWVYEVPDEHVFIGTRQVAFDNRHVIRKEKISHRQLRKIKE